MQYLNILITHPIGLNHPFTYKDFLYRNAILFCDYTVFRYEIYDVIGVSRITSCDYAFVNDCFVNLSTFV